VSRRTNVYIDGFNFYYGAIRGGPYKWLDLEAYFKLLRNDDEIRRIYYFTALVKGPTRKNQLTYLKAVETSPSVTVVLGKFKNKQVRCRVNECTFKGNRVFDSAEEKRTDVNIALQIVQDGDMVKCCGWSSDQAATFLTPSAN
jgi:hypothetical protein